MLSRRNIRIKVMQMLYSMSRDPKLTYSEALRQYRTNIHSSFELYLLNLLQIAKIMAHAKEVANKKHSKLRPTAEDLAFTDKLASNNSSSSLIDNISFNQRCKSLGIDKKIDDDAIRRLYIEFAKDEVYKEYIKKESNSVEDHNNVIIHLFKFCSSNEVFNDLMEDHYPSWIDDKSLVVGAIKKQASNTKKHTREGDN